MKKMAVASTYPTGGSNEEHRLFASNTEVGDVAVERFGQQVIYERFFLLHGLIQIAVNNKSCP